MIVTLFACRAGDTNDGSITFCPAFIATLTSGTSFSAGIGLTAYACVFAPWLQADA